MVKGQGNYRRSWKRELRYWCQDYWPVLAAIGVLLLVYGGMFVATTVYNKQITGYMSEIHPNLINFACFLVILRTFIPGRK